MKILDKYREKYGHYNQETLQVAAQQNPEWLKEIILDNEIKSFSRSFSILALSENPKDEYFEFIKKYALDGCPFMREASFMGLFQYHCYASEQYPDLKSFFESCLAQEQGEGVRSKINSLLEDWEFWASIYKDDNQGNR